MGCINSSSSCLLHKGLLVNPVNGRCVLRVLCPVSRPVTTLDYVVLKDKTLVFVVGLGPEVSFRACLSATRIMPHYQMLVNHTAFYLSFMFCLETSKDGLGPTDFLFPHTPACTGTQYTPTLCQVEISFNAFWNCFTNSDVVLVACRAFRAI